MNKLTDKQKIQMLTAVLIYNTVTLNGLIYLLQRDNKFCRKKIAQQWDAIEVLMETADLSDERFQQFGFDVKFELMQRENLKGVKPRWWKRRG